MENEKTLLTKEGYEKLQSELQYLLDVERPKVIDDIKEARSQGDLSENADYDAARARQAQVEYRITELQKMLSSVQLIDENGSSKIVKLGTTVTIAMVSDNNKVSGETEQYTIVGSVEADPLNGRISNESPLANALLGKTQGEIVLVKVAKPYKVKIMSIKR